MAVYLKYADLRVYEGDKLIGEAIYDARNGEGRIIDKFGHTETKLNPLIDQMLSGNPGAPPGGGS